MLCCEHLRGTIRCGAATGEGETEMGLGSSKQSTARKKVMAVNAFEDAGERHREKRGLKSSKKSRSSRASSKIEYPSDESSDCMSSPKSSWVRLREKSLPQIEFPGRCTLKLSDFNRVVRKRTLDADETLPIDIPYGNVHKVRLFNISNYPRCT